MIPGRARPATVGTRLLTTPERRAAAGVVSLCHAPTVAAEGTGFPSGHPSGLTAPLLPQAALVRLGPLALGAVRHRPSALRFGAHFLRLRAKAAARPYTGRLATKKIVHNNNKNAS